MSAPSRDILVSISKQAVELLTLAKDKSPAARAALVNQLYDLCFAGTDLSTTDRSDATKLLVQIFSHASADVRMSLADRVSGDPLAPRDLVMAIANDLASIAYPVLAESPVLSDADLVEIVRHMTTEHQLGIAQRDSVGPTVTEALVETGDPRAMRWVLENPGATISRMAMETIVDASQGEDQLHRHLVRRDDVPADLATKMQAWLPQPPDRMSAEVGDCGNDKARRLAVELRQSGTLTIDVLLKVLRAGDLPSFEVLLAAYCRMSVIATRQMIESTDGRALAAVLKAQGVDKGTFASIATLIRKARYPDDTTPDNTLLRAAAAFDGITAPHAAEILTKLQAAHPEAATVSIAEPT